MYSDGYETEIIECSSSTAPLISTALTESKPVALTTFVSYPLPSFSQQQQHASSSIFDTPEHPTHSEPPSIFDDSSAFVPTSSFAPISFEQKQVQTITPPLVVVPAPPVFAMTLDQPSKGQDDAKLHDDKPENNQHNVMPHLRVRKAKRLRDQRFRDLKQSHVLRFNMDLRSKCELFARTVRHDDEELQRVKKALMVLDHLYTSSIHDDTIVIPTAVAQPKKPKTKREIAQLFFVSFAMFALIRLLSLFILS